MEKSNVSHSASDLCVFGARTLRKGQTSGYYYRSLLYADLHTGRSKSKILGVGVMLVTAEIFRRWANEIVKRTKKRDWDERTVWIRSAPFRVMR